MNKKDLVRNIANSTKLSQKTVSQVIDAFLEEMEKAVKSKNTLSIVGYLTLSVKKRSSRTAINPKTKQKITIPAKDYPTIKVGSKLKNLVK
ncbi:MAG: HU family DNA-binding protein [Spirochaetia bacterium]|nr:HU family DNA-binding protein [Spirochaetota bacterium]MCX8097218.1 HU family DNA-binding protein [Spirochaetota bacterium]MDW8111972.1 HU family DNA-binding protein [Spirochaetia bacterium]